jgi:hypothetical protein
MPDYPNFPPGKSTKRKLHGGPWAGESIGFREDQTELVITTADKPLGRPYIGRYVVRKIQQKNRVISRVEWETAEQKQALIRERLRQPGVRIY